MFMVVPNKQLVEQHRAATSEIQIATPNTGIIV
jgi:hypothetical protein